MEDGQIQKTVFPSLKPSRREDALLLQQWLADMMAQLTSNAPQAPGDQVCQPWLSFHPISFHLFSSHVITHTHEYDMLSIRNADMKLDSPEAVE